MPTRTGNNPPNRINLQAVSEDLRAKMQWLEEIKATRSRHEGALEQVMQQLQNDHGVDTIERATALLTRRQRNEAALLRQLQGKLDELQTIEQRIRDAAGTQDDPPNTPIPF